MAYSIGLGACADGEEAPRTEARDGRLLIPEAWETPGWAPNDSVIMYRVKGGHVWTSSPDGKNTEQLVDALWSRWSPDGSWLSYFVDDLEDKPLYETNELWISSADRRHNTQVAEDVWYYNWSPDSSYISYMVIGEDGYSLLQDSGGHSWVHGELWVWSMSAREEKLLSEGVSDWEWSPDGHHVSFLVDDGDMDPNDREDELWLWSTGGEGSGGIRLLAHNVSSWWWSPDGDYIAYSVVDSGERYLTNLWVTAPLGNALQIAQATIWDVIWSPSGGRVGFLTTPSEVGYDEWDGAGNLRIMDLSDELERRIGDSQLFVGNIRDWGWSPDGSHIVYFMDDDDSTDDDEDGPLDGDLSVWSSHTQNTERIVSDTYVGVWEWSPDESTLAYIVDDGDGDGSGTPPDDGDLWVWTAGKGGEWLSSDVARVEWSMDGAWLAYWVPGGRSNWDRWHRSMEGFPLWVWSAETGISEQIASDVWTWRWSPAGTRIAYYKATEGEHMDVIGKGLAFGELWVWSAEGDDSGLVVNRADRIEWEWSPSGDYLVYGNEMGIFIADIARTTLEDVPQ